MIDLSSVALAHQAATLAGKLEALGAPTLAAQGREIEASFDGWTIEPPPTERRETVVAALNAWARRAIRALAEPKEST